MTSKEAPVGLDPTIKISINTPSIWLVNNDNNVLLEIRE